MAAAAPQPAPYQHHPYTKSAHYTPTSSGSGSNTPNTPLDSSPTSPRTTFCLPSHAPPIRPLKTPIYIPAALRRTEKPGRQSPPKPDAASDASSTTWNINSPLGPGPGPGDMLPATRLATEDMNSIYNDVPLSPLAGPITRNHWQPDSSTLMCTASSCQQPFSFFNRRHHCRKCGGIYCAQHSMKATRLNEHALFHAEGDWQRSCDRCHAQYREWEQLRSSRTNSESSGSTTAVPIEPPQAKRPENARVGSLATSFGGNWNWSTF